MWQLHPTANKRGIGDFLQLSLNLLALHFYFLIAIFNFPIEFGSLKTMQKVRSIDLLERGKILPKDNKYLKNISLSL